MAGLKTRSMMVAVAALACGAPALASGLKDVEAVPQIDKHGKEGYREFLSSGRHRAFVIAPGGAWAWKGDEVSADAAAEAAMLNCQRSSEQPCVPYAVDDRLVFDAKVWPTLWGPYQDRAEAARAYTGKERGNRFYDLAIKTSAGKAMKLSDLRGKAVVVHFWGSWCPPCRREMPEMQALHRELGASSGIQFVLLQVREDFAAASQWAQQQKLALPLYDSGVRDMSSDQLLLANGKTIPDRTMAVAFPSTYVLDKHGIVVFSHVGPLAGWAQYLPFLRDVAARSGK